MKLKPIVVITVLSLVIASLLISGCTTSTTSTTSNTNQTPSATSSTTTHDAFLENYLAAYKNATNTSNRHIKAWELTWINSTSARVEWTALNKTTNTTANYVDTISVFPKSEAATQYLNATNKTAYSLVSTQYQSGAYKDLTGHAPQIYEKYEWNEGDPSNISAYTYHGIIQLDNIVFVTTGKILS